MARVELQVGSLERYSHSPKKLGAGANASGRGVYYWPLKPKVMAMNFSAIFTALQLLGPIHLCEMTLPQGVKAPNTNQIFVASSLQAKGDQGKKHDGGQTHSDSPSGSDQQGAPQPPKPQPCSKQDASPRCRQ